MINKSQKILKLTNAFWRQIKIASTKYQCNRDRCLMRGVEFSEQGDCVLCSRPLVAVESVNDEYPGTIESVNDKRRKTEEARTEKAFESVNYQNRQSQFNNDEHYEVTIKFVNAGNNRKIYMIYYNGSPLSETDIYENPETHKMPHSLIAELLNQLNINYAPRYYEKSQFNGSSISDENYERLINKLKQNRINILEYFVLPGISEFPHSRI